MNVTRIEVEGKYGRIVVRQDGQSVVLKHMDIEIRLSKQSTMTDCEEAIGMMGAWLHGVYAKTGMSRATAGDIADVRRVVDMVIPW